MKALFLEKICEVSQIRSSTLNCLVVKESFLQTATETLLLHSSLTTNNSWPLLFSKQTINTETHVSGGHVDINFLLLHYPSSGGREGPLFIREIFEHWERSAMSTCVHFSTFFWNHFHSWNPLSTSFCSYFPVLDILHFTGDGSGMSICKSSYWSLVDIWTKCNRTILAKCGTFYWCLGDDLFLHGNLLFIGHLSFNGG